MSATVVIDVDNQYLHFSAAHFTIFSASERERLHGHNFSVRARAKSQVQADGLAFNYQILKQALHKVCDSLDEYTLIAKDSPHLHIGEKGEYFSVEFAGQKMLLLQSDTLLLPIPNITLESLGSYMIECLKQEGLFEKAAIETLELEISSGPGQRVTSFCSPGRPLPLATRKQNQ